MKTKQLFLITLLSLLGIFGAKAGSFVPNKGNKIKTDNSVNLPFKVGVGYTITNVAGSLSLTSGDGVVRIATPEFADSTQVFYFEPAPEGAEAKGYNMRDANGTYIWRSGSWDTKSGETTLTAKDAIFNIVDYGTYVQIKNEGSGSVLGVDNTTSNSAVYANKNGMDNKNNWILMPHTPTAALEAAIVTAEGVAEGADVGTEYDQVPQNALDELNAAIANAKALLPTVSTAEAANAAVATLNAAVEKFNTSFNPLPNFASGENYTVTHYGGCLLTATTTGNATITAKAESGATDAQMITFEKASYQDMPDVYYVKSVSNGTYLVRDGGYNTMWRADNDTLAAIVQVTRLEGKWLGLKFVTTASFLGVDSKNTGSATYSDKAGVGNTGAYWTIQNYVAIVLEREAFKTAMTKAETALAAMKPGYKIGEYFPEDITAFSKVISKAKSDANKAQSQEILDAVTAQLLEDIDTYVAKIHDRDYLNLTALKAEVDKAEKTLNASVAGDCNGQYPESAIAAFTTALTTAKSVLGNEEATQTEVDAAVEALQTAEKTFAETKVVINYVDLNDAINNAQEVVKETADLIGDGPGRYSVESYDALKTAISNAQAIAKSNTVNQKRVDQEVETLENTLNEFYNSFRENDYSELQALVDQAAELIRKAEAGEIACDAQDLQDLKDSYSKNAAALESKNQNVIDKAVKLLRRDIDIFNTMTSGISVLPVGVTAKVYTIDGVYVGEAHNMNLASGVYVVRYDFGSRIVIKKICVK